jgi:hypothetical protein
MLESLAPVFGLPISLGICYLIALFAPNFVATFSAIVALQVAGFIAVVETCGFLSYYLILNIGIVACMTFVGFMIAAQMHLAIRSGRAKRLSGNE